MKNKKGFTLAELLVVVAIIAVLVAITIPIFSSKIHEAKVATDWANIRSFYAQMKVEEIESGDLSFLKNYSSMSTKTKYIRGTNSSLNLVGGTAQWQKFGNDSAGYPMYALIYTCDKNCPEHKVTIRRNIVDQNLNEYKWGS